MSEKLCLKWNDFQENVNSAFGNLREDKEFTDVTLACEDGQQIEAHKVVLAASSPFFQNLLNKNVKKHHHPLIFMKGVKFGDLCAIVDFLYLGEANVFQESLDSFLGIAEELKLKGLTGQTEDIDNKTETSSARPPVQKMNSNSYLKQENPGLNTDSRHSSGQIALAQNYNESKVTIPNFTSGDLQQLDEKVKSLMEFSENLIPNGKGRARICKVCGKEGQSMAIRDHIEAHHLEGVSLPCKLCGKEYRSRLMLRKHTCISKLIEN